MSLWTRAFPRREGRDGPIRRGRQRAASARRDRPSRPQKETGPDDLPVLVEEHDSLLLLRSPLDDTLGPADVADLVRGLRSGEGVVTLIAGAHAAATAAFPSRLGELLDSLRAAGTTAVRLAVAGAGDEGPDRPAVAAGIAEDWDITVDAPAGAVLAVPGGSLFAPGTAGTGGGWWRFAPEAEPVPLGPRCPAPSWQSALGRVPSRTSGGCVVHQIPAGLLVRPAEAAAPEPGDLYHAVPVDPRRPTVVVGVPRGEDVSAEEVAELLAHLPPGSAGPVRLVPGGLRDLLPLGQRVADLLDAEVQVTTGLPLFAAGRPVDSYAARSVLIGADGSPRWLPFVDAVMCRPSRGSVTAPAPQLLRWSPPLPGPGSPEKGSVHLSDRWQVTVTRAGLWVSTLGSIRSHRTDRQVLAEGPAIEIGTPGEQLDDSLWPALSRLLGALTTDMRVRATLYVHGTVPDGGSQLRRLAADHGLRTIRYTTAAAGPRLGAGLRPPVPAPEPVPDPPRAPATGPDQDPSAPAPTHHPAPANESVSGPPPMPEGRRPNSATATVDVGDAPASPTAAPDIVAEGQDRPAASRAPSARLSAPSRPGAGSRVDGPPRRHIRPGHRSTDGERSAFRALADSGWEAFVAAADRAFVGVPAPSAGDREAARVDLIAVQRYLDDTEDLLSHGALTRALRTGDDRLLSYAACLMSGLHRMPAHRGMVLRGAGAQEGRPDSPRPGDRLADRAPVSTVVWDDGAPLPRGACYAVWSVTGRSVRQLSDRRDDHTEVVFPAGTAFRVLDIRLGTASELFLLRELPGPGTAGAVPARSGTPAGLDDADRAVLARLDEALRGRSSPSGKAGWPRRCAGPIGDGP